MNLDEPLAKITAGDWDPAAGAKERLAAKIRQRKSSAVWEKILKPYRAQDYKATLTALDEATSGDPDLAEEFAAVKFAALCNGGDVEAGLAVGAKLLKSNHDKPLALNNDFWYVIDPKLKKEPDPRVAELALRAARRADELTKGKDVSVLDTLAVALFRTGLAAEAVATEEKALKQLEAETPDRSHPYYKLFNERLELFRKAAAEKTKR
jgi:hypothetical protein